MKRILFILTVLLLSACTDQAKSQNDTEIVNQTESQDSTMIVSSIDEVAVTDPVEKESEREIAWVVESENLYEADPGVLKNLYIPDRNVIIRATVTESNADNNAVFLQEMLDANSYTPITPMKIQINEVILGKVDSSIDTIYVTGGTISLQELYLNLPEGTVDKMGLNDLSEAERLTQYVSYEEDADFSYETGKEYILVVSNSPGFPNRVYGNGYGTFIPSDDQGRGSTSFTNAVSGRDFSSELDSLIE